MCPCCYLMNKRTHLYTDLLYLKITAGNAAASSTVRNPCGNCSCGGLWRCCCSDSWCWGSNSHFLVVLQDPCIKHQPLWPDETSRISFNKVDAITFDTVAEIAACDAAQYNHLAFCDDPGVGVINVNNLATRSASSLIVGEAAGWGILSVASNTQTSSSISISGRASSLRPGLDLNPIQA